MNEGRNEGMIEGMKERTEVGVKEIRKEGSTE